MMSTSSSKSTSLPAPIPSGMLDKLYQAVKGDPGSRYYDFKVERNSRCATVTYPDGVTVDLMPVARLPGGPERSGVLFHHNAKRDEKYRKEVNPKAFTLQFNARIKSSDVFAFRYRDGLWLMDCFRSAPRLSRCRTMFLSRRSLPASWPSSC
ncbi:hypothetical protein [Rhizobium grahamii]|uniref:hypothetical protein n=1 Tax=Rhizobium grahamii TaxID=1120045 RepID=UPI0002E39AEB|nr:hypothetical protein [Rhizobium grahamii]